jgi:protein-serine/threonine kinase
VTRESPCYATPELVISLYVASAVDIWSCGIILYVMLAGYFPFDYGPAKPDRDHTNLLYKHTVNKPLSFPEYVSSGARDILSSMLVPDPASRSTLKRIMAHSWLAAYQRSRKDSGLDETDEETAFGKTVGELENEALEQHLVEIFLFFLCLLVALKSIG